MSDLFAPFARAAADRDADARAAKAAGCKVVGYLGNTVPTELIVAAGGFPLRLAAEADATPLGDRYMEALFDPVVRAVFEGALGGRYDFLDAIVLPRTSDSVQRLYYYLCEARRMGEAAVSEPLLYDLLHTPWYTSAEYNLARTRELAAALTRVCGRPVTDEGLAAAIVESNRRRAALDAFSELRRVSPARVGGRSALQVLAASQTMAPEAFETALAAVMQGPHPPVTGARTVVAGSGQLSPALHELLEGLGGVVVGDFHEFGEPMIGPPIDTSAAPMRALCTHYHRNVASSRTFPQSPEPLVRFAQAARADAVVFYFFAEEEALTWEYPAQRRALEAAGIASLCFEDMPHRPDTAALRPALSAFLADLPAAVAS